MGNSGMYYAMLITDWDVGTNIYCCRFGETYETNKTPLSRWRHPITVLRGVTNQVDYDYAGKTYE